MLGYIFGGLGELVAPRPDSEKEIWAFIKNGLFDRAVQALRIPGHKFDVNEADPKSGMQPLHFACAGGNLELVMELLTQGADFTAMDAHGNSCLHLAALNEHKSVIEILLRCGSDPSVPNHAGTLAIEMARSPMVEELFLRDRNNIFSPIVTAKNLFRELMENNQLPQLTHNADNTESNKISLPDIVNLNSDMDRLASSTPVKSPKHSGENYTIVGVTSAQKVPKLPTVHNDRQHEYSAAVPQPFTPFSATQLQPPSSTMVEVHDTDESSPTEDRHRLERELIEAARETAKVHLLNSEEFEVRRLAANYCQRFDLTQMNKLLAYNPRLPMMRVAELGNFAIDGSTILHIAANLGCLQALQLFKEKGQGVSFWVRDLQGRTPLHLAAAKGHKEVCEFLRREMYQERALDPVGYHAPSDLAGTTPVGWAKKGANGRPKSEIEQALFVVGDKSVFSPSPVKKRTGKSPWRAPPSVFVNNSKENVVYAFSEAHGWTLNMEDRIAISCPVPGRPAWSLFAVFDGHGGSFSSQFLADVFPRILAEQAAEADHKMGTSFLPGGTANDIDTTPEFLQQLLIEVCLKADASLKADPHMKMTRDNVTKELRCFDSSGSTAVIGLVTSMYVAIANVGDSRAVLAQRSTLAPSATELRTDPFAGTPRDSISEISTHSSVDAERAATPSEAENSNTSAEKKSAKRRASSRCALDAIALSTDHKGRLPEEAERIQQAGAILQHVKGEGEDAVYEVYTTQFAGRLRMTRSFGDFYLKVNKELPIEQQAVVAVPEVKIHPRANTDAFLVLACDGIWDVMNNQEVVDLVGQSLGFSAYGGPVGGVNTQAAAKAADDVIQECLARGSQDNMSVILVVPGAPPSVVPSNPPSTSQSTKKHERRPSLPLNDMPVPEIDIHKFNANAYSRPTHIKGLNSREDDDSDSSDEGLLNSPRVDSTAELIEAISGVSLNDPRYESPLNTATGSERVNKQLHFEDVSGKKD